MPHREQPLVGQQCIIQGGDANHKPYIGTVVDWESSFPYESISVRHPITNIVTKYAVHSVELLPPVRFL